jgi:hypothetical protein
MRKARIRRVMPGLWKVERPRFGFGTADVVAEPFDTWAHAMDSVQRRTASAGPQVTAAPEPSRSRSYWRYSNIPIEIT